MKQRIDPALALLVVLLAAHFAVILAHYHHPLITDEIYWVRNARHLAEHGTLPSIDPAALAAEKGEAWAASDWRPQAYTLFLVACSLGDFDDPDVTLRLRATIVPFLLLAAIVIALHRVAVRAGASRWIAAVVLGVSPWTFEFVNEIGADSLNAFVTTLALLLLWRWIAEPRHGAAWLFWSALVASFPLLVRPEMLVLAPVMIGLAMLLRRPFTRAELFAAVAAFALLLGVQVAYRTWFTGKPGIYGGQLQIVNSGAFHWAETWPGTEKEGYDFVYLLTEGRPIELPDRAFADERERQRVESIVDRVRARGRYAREDDAAFEALARERKQRSPLMVASLRLWHMAHLWLNNENPNPVLDALAPVPRSARRPIYGALLLLRLAIYAAAAFAAVRAAVRLRRGEADAFDRLTLLMAGFILARSMLVGLVLNWKVHRYVLVAWPAMLWCACAALRARTSTPVSRGPAE